MPSQAIEKLAYLLVYYSVEVKEKEKIRIGESTVSEPILKEIYKTVLHAGDFSKNNKPFVTA